MCLVFEETKETWSLEGWIENSNELPSKNVSICFNGNFLRKLMELEMITQLFSKYDYTYAYLYTHMHGKTGGKIFTYHCSLQQYLHWLWVTKSRNNPCVNQWMKMQKQCDKSTDYPSTSREKRLLNMQIWV